MKQQIKLTQKQRLKNSLSYILRTHNGKTASGNKVSSFGTQAKRRIELEAGFKDLWDLGYKLDDVRQFKGRHMRALAELWEKRGLSPTTIQNKISIYRIFAGWIGKGNMIEASERYVSSPDKVSRSLVAKEDKTWSGKGIDIEKKIAGVAERCQFSAAQLRLARAFGIRIKEAMLLHPHGADKGAYLDVSFGTKGGRDRMVPIETAEQRAALEHAKSLVTNINGSMIPKEFTLERWRNHFYYVMRKEGLIRKELGATAHGLRHERLNEVYTEHAGTASPIKGGKKGDVSHARDSFARHVVAEIAGHSREDKAAPYIGGKGN